MRSPRTLDIDIGLCIQNCCYVAGPVGQAAGKRTAQARPVGIEASIPRKSRTPTISPAVILITTYATCPDFPRSRRSGDLGDLEADGVVAVTKCAMTSTRQASFAGWGFDVLCSQTRDQGLRPSGMLVPSASKHASRSRSP